VNIYPAVRAVEKRSGDRVSNAISESALLTAQRLANEPEIAQRVKSADIRIVAARYNLATGAVQVLSQE
jgi:carbonic anhydrase